MDLSTQSDATIVLVAIYGAEYVIFVTSVLASKLNAPCSSLELAKRNSCLAGSSQIIIYILNVGCEWDRALLYVYLLNSIRDDEAQ